MATSNPNPFDESERELSVACSFSMPPSLLKALGDLASEFQMSRSAFLTGITEATVLELRALLRNRPELLDVVEAENPRPRRRTGNSTDLVDHQHDLVQAAIRRYRAHG